MRGFLAPTVFALGAFRVAVAAAASPTVAPELTLDTGSPVGASANAYGVAWDGTNFFIAYGASGGVRGTRVSKTGTILDPAGIAIPAEAAIGSPAVGYGAGYFLAAFNAGNECQVVRVASNGTVVDSSPIVLLPLLAQCTATHVTFDGTDFLVATDYASSGTRYPVTVTVTPSGTVGTPQRLEWWLTTTQAANLSVAGSAFDGAHHVVLLSGPAVVANCPPTHPAPCTGLAVQQAPDGAGSVVTWVGDTIPYSGGAAGIACDGATGCFAVWSTGTGVRGARVGLDGSTLDTSGFAISRGAILSGTTLAPSVTWDGTHYLVTWASGSSLLGARVMGNTLVDASDIVVGGASFSTASAIASTPSGSLLTLGPANGVSQAVLLDGALSPQGAAFPFAFASPNEEEAAVASNGAGYLVVWLQSGSTSKVVMSRFDATGAPLDAAPIVLSPAGDAPAVSSVGGGYLVTWSDASAGLPWKLHGSIVPAAGSPGAPFLLPANESFGQGQALNASVAASGTGYLVAWEDERNGTWTAQPTERLPRSSSRSSLRA